MKKIGFVLTSLAILASCKSEPTQSVSSEIKAQGASGRGVFTRPTFRGRLPSFDVQAWKSLQTGPMTEAFFLQDQIYNINIESPALPVDDEKLATTLTFTDSAGKIVKSTPATLKIRGFTSRNNPKKQYSVSLTKKNGKDDAQSLLGMAKAENWVLSAPYNDKSLLRDITAYNISNKLGQWAPRTRIVTLTRKLGEGPVEKLGIYVLTEKNEFGPGRIDVPKSNKNEVTAFQATFDHLHEGDNVVWTGRGTDVVLEYPSAKKISAEEQTDFMTIFNDVERIVASAEGKEWAKIFQNRLDLESAVDFFIVQEMAHNSDGFRLSSGFYIPPASDKIYFGPVWDFNIAFGNADYNNGAQTTSWRSMEDGVWFGVLIKHPEFCEALKKRWATARADGRLSNNTIFNIIDKHAEVMAPATAENFTLWPILGTYLWPNPYWLTTWSDEKDALKSWIALRNQWMDQAIEGMACDGTLPQNAEVSEKAEVLRD